MSSSDCILKVRGLQKSFGGHAVLKGIDLDLHKNEVVILRGQNGSGKTTLVNILTGHQFADGGVVNVLNGAAWSEYSFPVSFLERYLPFYDRFSPEHLSRSGVGRSWQEDRLFESQTVEDNLLVAEQLQKGENPFNVLFRQRAVRSAENVNRNTVAELLHVMEMAGLNKHTVDHISRGEARKIAIFQAIRSGAKILFLDEPLGGLDAAGVAQVLEFLGELVKKKNLTLVIIEHALNIPALLPIATTVWSLDGGRVKIGSSKDLEVGGGADFDSNSWLRRIAGGGSSIEKRLLPGGATISIASRNNNKESPSLAVKSLTVKRGRRSIIGWRMPNGEKQSFELELYPGQIAVLEAVNGWGKSTLLEALMGLLPAETGQVSVNGSLKAHSYQRSRAGMALVRPRLSVFDSLTGRENMAISKISSVPEGLDIDRSVATFSGGEKQRMVWHLALNSGALVLLLDEPLTHLDSSWVKKVEEDIAGAKDKTFLICFPKRAAFVEPAVLNTNK